MIFFLYRLGDKINIAIVLDFIQYQIKGVQFTT